MNETLEKSIREMELESLVKLQEDTIEALLERISGSDRPFSPSVLAFLINYEPR